MNKNNKNVTLYNVIFPVWMLCFFPAAWLIVLPGNFIIDSVVLLISLIILKVEDKKEWYKKYILKIYGFGMLADIAGAVYMLSLELMFGGLIGGPLGDGLDLTLPALLISAALIFVFNYFFTFKHIHKKLRLQLSLIFAVVTAPYTFLIPTSWTW